MISLPENAITNAKNEREGNETDDQSIGISPSVLIYQVTEENKARTTWIVNMNNYYYH